MRVLITGGAGFIGHNVTSKLMDLGHSCTVVDNFTDYGIVPKSEMSFLTNERLKVLKSASILKDDIRGDLTTAFSVSRPEVVIHLAAFPRAKVVQHDPVLGKSVLIDGLKNLLQSCKQNRVKRFVYISSSMVYGNFESGTSEDAECNPVGLYGKLKLEGEHIVSEFCTRHDIEFVILRPSAVYGPADVLDRVVSKFFYNAVNDLPLVVNGLYEELDFTYVTDAADGIVAATLSSLTANKIYNITNGKSRPIVDAAKIVAGFMNRRVEIMITPKSSAYPSRGALNCDRAKSDFGFMPTVNLEEGLRKYYEWLNETKFFDRIA